MTARSHTLEFIIDWLDCPIVERVPGKVSGVPIIKHSRVRPEDQVVNRAEGEEWLADAYDLRLPIVHQVLAFYERHKHQLASAV